MSICGDREAGLSGKPLVSRVFPEPLSVLHAVGDEDLDTALRNIDIKTQPTVSPPVSVRSWVYTID